MYDSSCTGVHVGVRSCMHALAASVVQRFGAHVWPSVLSVARTGLTKEDCQPTRPARPELRGSKSLARHAPPVSTLSVCVPARTLCSPVCPVARFRARAGGGRRSIRFRGLRQPALPDSPRTGRVASLSWIRPSRQSFQKVDIGCPELKLVTT